MVISSKIIYVIIGVIVFIGVGLMAWSPLLTKEYAERWALGGLFGQTGTPMRTFCDVKIAESHRTLFGFSVTRESDCTDYQYSEDDSGILPKYTRTGEIKRPPEFEKIFVPFWAPWGHLLDGTYGM